MLNPSRLYHVPNYPSILFYILLHSDSDSGKVFVWLFSTGPGPLQKVCEVNILLPQIRLSRSWALTIGRGFFSAFCLKNCSLKRKCSLVFQWPVFSLDQWVRKACFSLIRYLWSLGRYQNGQAQETCCLVLPEQHTKRGNCWLTLLCWRRRSSRRFGFVAREVSDQFRRAVAAALPHSKGTVPRAKSPLQQKNPCLFWGMASCISAPKILRTYTQQRAKFPSETPPLPAPIPARHCTWRSRECHF